MKGRIVTVLLVGLFCLGVVVTRAIWQGRSALHAGDQAMASGETEEAIRWWRRAARWYVPLAPHVGRAHDRLAELGAAAQAAGELETALAAWQGVRGSILATRSLFTPHSERLEPANRRIAALLALMDERGGEGANREAYHLRLLVRDDSPSVPWTVVALLGFLLWIGGGVLFAVRAVGPEDRLVARPAVTAAVLVVAGLLVWMLGLHNA